MHSRQSHRECRRAAAVGRAAGIEDLKTVAIALVRGLASRRGGTIGNFWVDLVRTCGRILLPLSVVAAIVLAAFGAWLVTNRADTIDYAVRSYRVAPNGVSLSFDVSKKASSQATCAVVAQDRSAAAIGSLQNVVVGPNPQGKRVTTVTVFIPVHGKAVSASVINCRVTHTA